MTEKADKIALFDMDNTLFDYEEQIRVDYRKLMAPGEEEPPNLFEEERPHIKARLRLIKSVPGWWRSLPKFRLGWDLYWLANNIGFDNHIFTKGPSSHPTAWTEKVECIKIHLGDQAHIDIAGKDKSGRYGLVLVDDYPKYCLDWLKHRPRGLVILPAQAYNADFRHPNAIRYTGDNLLEVEKLLRAVFAREPGQHWEDLV